MIFTRVTLSFAAVGLLAISQAPLPAQELKVQPTPYSVWLDFQAPTRSARAALPIWMESFESHLTQPSTDHPALAAFRIRLRRMEALNGELQLRLFFSDEPGKAPRVSGWSETGVQLYSSLPLGTGLDLPTSESLIIPTAGIDYLEIEVPGDGANVRSAFLTTLKKAQSRYALDFEPSATLLEDPFSNPPRPDPSKDDSYLFGRIKAAIEPGPIRLTSGGAAARSTLEFELDSVPLVAVISFEVLDVDPLYPPELTLNDRPLGRVSVRLPDLADPAYQGRVRAMEPDMRFRYAGWVQCQQVVPGSALLNGPNKLMVELHKESSSVAIRAVEISLKHHWKNLDYELAH